MFEDIGINDEVYELVAIKRDWCPKWLFSFFSPVIKYQPFRIIFVRELK